MDDTPRIRRPRLAAATAHQQAGSRCEEARAGRRRPRAARGRAPPIEGPPNRDSSPARRPPARNLQAHTSLQMLLAGGAHLML